MDERKSPHTLLLDQRKKLTLMGVSDVLRFDEEEICLDTDLGTLTVSGNSLHINRLNVDNGEMIIEGEIDGCVYSNQSRTNGGLFARMFR